MRSLVWAGIALAARELFITTETVAGDSFRYSAKERRLTGLAAETGWNPLARALRARVFFISIIRIPALQFLVGSTISIPGGPPQKNLLTTGTVWALNVRS